MLLVLWVVWTAAGVSKLLSPAGFLDVLREFGAPWKSAPLAAIYIPSLEIAMAAALLFRHWRRVALLLLGLTLIMFTLLLLVHTNSASACGCFGSVLVVTTKWAVLRNIALLAITGYLWRTESAAMEVFNSEKVVD